MALYKGLLSFRNAYSTHFYVDVSKIKSGIIEKKYVPALSGSRIITLAQYPYIGSDNLENYVYAIKQLLPFRPELFILIDAAKLHFIAMIKIILSMFHISKMEYCELYHVHS